MFLMTRGQEALKKFLKGVSRPSSPSGTLPQVEVVWKKSVALTHLSRFGHWPIIDKVCFGLTCHTAAARDVHDPPLLCGK